MSARFPASVFPGVTSNPEEDVDALYQGWQGGSGEDVLDPFSAHEQERAMQDLVSSSDERPPPRELHPHRFVHSPFGLFPRPMDPHSDPPVVLSMSVTVANSYDRSGSSSGMTEEAELSLGGFGSAESSAPRTRKDITAVDLFRLLGKGDGFCPICIFLAVCHKQ